MLPRLPLLEIQALFLQLFWHRSPPSQAGGNHSRMKNEPVCVAGCWRGLASLPGGDCLLQQPRRGQQGLLGGTFRQAEKSPRRVPVRSRMRSQRNRPV